MLVSYIPMTFKEGVQNKTGKTNIQSSQTYLLITDIMYVYAFKKIQTSENR